jgi:hypothetical protein
VCTGCPEAAEQRRFWAPGMAAKVGVMRERAVATLTAIGAAPSLGRHTTQRRNRVLVRWPPLHPGLAGAF